MELGFELWLAPRFIQHILQRIQVWFSGFIFKILDAIQVFGLRCELVRAPDLARRQE
jgi:hypothetical protein